MRRNHSKKSRHDVMNRKKEILLFLSILFISLFILLCSSISAFASSRQTKQALHKYYTSIEIQNGDTLWSLADTYMNEDVIDKDNYIQELIDLNHLDYSGEIHSGQYLTISYYSTEEK